MYHQIAIEKNSKKYTTLITNEGHYEFNRIPFGLVNVSDVFQALMNQVVVDLDDIIVPSKENLDRLDRFLTVTSTVVKPYVDIKAS